jgi:hypothetical protein
MDYQMVVPLLKRYQLANNAGTGAVVLILLK